MAGGSLCSNMPDFRYYWDFFFYFFYLIFFS
uniref:Uncharacterized protein n=1 Tax=Rhizophora mucronata TaxID=61149 RepID=A0A2P2PD40_RHIMU